MWGEGLEWLAELYAKILLLAGVAHSQVPTRGVAVPFPSRMPPKLRADSEDARRRVYSPCVQDHTICSIRTRTDAR